MKLGVVSVAGSFKGILIEVEYLPCVMVSSCQGLLQEFMQGFLGHVIQGSKQKPFLPQTLTKKHQNEPYTPVDTIQQYLEHFNALRKNVQMLGQHRPMQQ